MFLFKKCCFCADLRLGSFLIAYLMLIMRVAELVLSSIWISQVNNMIQHGIQSFAAPDVAFQRMVIIVSLLILVFEILLVIALLVGLCKRLDQHVEMYYVGSFAFLVMEVVVYAVVLLRYSSLLVGWAWALMAIETCSKLISVYFLMVIRSYYYKMKNEAKNDDVERLDGKQLTNYFASTTPKLIYNPPNESQTRAQRVPYRMEAPVIYFIRI